MNLVFLLIHSWRTLLYFTLVVKVCVCRIWWWLTTNVRYHLQWIYGNKGETVYHSLPSHRNLLAHSLIGVNCQPLFGTWVYTPTWTPLILLRASRRGVNSWNESLALHFSLHSGQHSWGKRDSRKVSLNIQLIYSPVLNVKDYGSWIPKGFYWSCDFLTYHYQLWRSSYLPLPSTSAPKIINYLWYSKLYADSSSSSVLI